MTKKTSAADACNDRCPVHRAAQIIDGKWTTQIVRDLLPGRKRYSELLHSLGGISPKILAARLKFLEEQGIISKTIYPEIPPRTEYQLTSRGEKLKGVIAAMAEFGTSLE